MVYHYHYLYSVYGVLYRHTLVVYDVPKLMELVRFTVWAEEVYQCLNGVKVRSEVRISVEVPKVGCRELAGMVRMLWGAARIGENFWGSCQD